MPTYQYQCDDCGNSFEQFQKFSDDPLTVCPACEGTIRRVIGNVGVVFKGSGWYINDSRPKASDSSDSATKPATDSKAADTPTKAKTEPAKATESKSSDAKPAAPATV
jgi:putative FmdB family regulatory protein